MEKIQLAALDLDGTLLNNNGQITEKNKAAIRKALSSGINVVISTGRPLSGIPSDQIKDTGIRYAITTNGSGVYEIGSRKCIYENSMGEDIIFPILDFLSERELHMDAFIDGKAYSTHKCRRAAEHLTIPDSLKRYILETRIRVEDLKEFIHENHLTVQKMTLNFFLLPDGTLHAREEVKNFLLSNPEVLCVSGGYGNLEFTRKGVTKGVGLHKLAEYLNIPVDHTMAIGDTENDIAILEAAGTGVAMANATDDVKAIADFVTLSNEEDGVAYAFEKLLYD